MHRQPFARPASPRARSGRFHAVVTRHPRPAATTGDRLFGQSATGLWSNAPQHNSANAPGFYKAAKSCSDRCFCAPTDMNGHVPHARINGATTNIATPPSRARPSFDELTRNTHWPLDLSRALRAECSPRPSMQSLRQTPARPKPSGSRRLRGIPASATSSSDQGRLIRPQERVHALAISTSGTLDSRTLGAAAVAHRLHVRFRGAVCQI